MKGKLLKFVSGVGLVAVAPLAHAAAGDPITTADGVVTAVTGITTSASTAYIAAAALGVAALTVGVLVYMSKRGWKLR